MTKKKRLAVLSAAGLFLACGITFVACDKDNTDLKNVSHTETFTEKSANANSIYQEAKLATLNICGKIDAAFALDSVSFKTVCEAEDFDGFISLIGITREDVKNHNTLLKSAYDMYIAENPELDDETNGPCVECTNNPLTKVYTITSKAQVAGGLTDVVSGQNDYEILALDIDCDRVCGWITNDELKDACIFLCKLINIFI